MRYLDSLHKEIERLRADQHVPGKMHCAKCKFTRHSINLSMATGTTGASYNKPEKCPNHCGPLWPVTWEQEARKGDDDNLAMFEEKRAAEIREVRLLRLLNDIAINCNLTTQQEISDLLRAHSDSVHPGEYREPINLLQPTPKD